MPLFNKKPNKLITNAPSPTNNYENNNSKPANVMMPTPTATAPVLSEKKVSQQSQVVVPPPPQSGQTNISKPQLVFHCQLAHGSPTGLISGFGSVKELYQKISECYDFSMEEVS